MTITTPAPSKIIPERIRFALSKVPRDLNPAARAYLDNVEEAWQQYGERGLKDQILYVLVNLSGWRGPEARECKAILKDYVKE